MLFNLMMGVGGLVLAGDSLGRGVRENLRGIFIFGCLEFITGLYFMVAAIGA